MLGDNQRNSEQNCLFGFAPAILVVKPDAQKLFILCGGSADRRRENRPVTTPSFPPSPASKKLRHTVISDMCESLSPENLEESGCAVCGKLTKNLEMTVKSDLDLNWELLERPSVTRKERFSSDDPIEELEGPIMAEDCDKVCGDCESRLLCGTVPLHSLHYGAGPGCFSTRLRLKKPLQPTACVFVG
jgi:hypothetical protein